MKTYLCSLMSVLTLLISTGAAAVDCKYHYPESGGFVLYCDGKRAAFILPADPKTGIFRGEIGGLPITAKREHNRTKGYIGDHPFDVTVEADGVVTGQADGYAIYFQRGADMTITGTLGDQVKYTGKLDAKGRIAQFNAEIVQ